MANPNSILAFESRFGPQSNLVDIAAFVQSASNKVSFQVDEADHDVVQECRFVSFSICGQTGLTRTSTAWRT